MRLSADAEGMNAPSEPPVSGAASATLTMVLRDEQATRRLAAAVAAILAPGDVVTLAGGLGAGKTAFARALIRHLAGDETVEVPSPTFTLVQLYDLPRLPVVHADFYRVESAGEIEEIGFSEAAERAAALIEWPERAAAVLPADRLEITFTLSPQFSLNYRHVRLTGLGSFAPRLERLAAVRAFLDRAGFSDADRAHLQGDASSRVYERVSAGGRKAILMNAPRRPDGPPVRNGLPYSRIAHLAEDVKPFVAIARTLRERGFSAPEIYDADLDAGLVLLEDLGVEPIVGGPREGPLEERYAAAIDVLLALHAQNLPVAVPAGEDGAEYRLPPYDLDAYLIETELLLDWYLPHRGGTIDLRGRAEFLALWRGALDPTIIAAPPTWVLRDFHSPNLLWLAEREGIARIGLLDFQDALLGSAAYDLVSLLQDARVDVPGPLEVALLARYVKGREGADPHFDRAAFAQAYATLGAQRATKILGIFARLDRRDGKPQYLRHLPRVWGYLRHALMHPSLAALKAWYITRVPAPPVPARNGRNES